MNTAIDNNYLSLLAVSELERNRISQNWSCSTPKLDTQKFLSLAVAEALDVTVRCPTLLDISALATLFSEMQRHYRRPVTDEQAVKAATLACQPVEAPFDPRILVAAAGETIIGSI